MPAANRAAQMRRSQRRLAALLAAALTLALVLAAPAAFSAGSNQADESAQSVSAAPGYPAYNGRAFPQVRGQKTGFFHTEKQGDTWWLIDPNGFGFYIIGAQVVDYWGGHLAHTDDYPYHQTILEKYGSEEGWADATLARLEQWGFNTLGQASAKMLHYRNMPHVGWLYAALVFIGEDDADNIVPRTFTGGWGGFPNVFSPRWRSFVDERARDMCAPHRDDPWLIGYYIDNELQWWGTQEPWVGESGMALEAMKKPADHEAKQAWMQIVREHCPTIEDFNNAWETDYASFEELAASTQGHVAPGDAALQMTRAYLRLAAEHYFRVTAEAIRRHDPNHLVLGCRFAVGAPPGVWQVAGKYCDVMTFNLYPHVHPDRGAPMDLVESFQRVHDESGKPVFLTEWSIIAQTESRPVEPSIMAMHVFDQPQRASAAASFQRTMLSLPFMVGTCWLLYIDSFGDADYLYNCGLVNKRDEPYTELTNALAAVHHQAADLHSAGVLDSVYQRPAPVRWSQPLPQAEPQAPPHHPVFRSGALALVPTPEGALSIRYHGHTVADWSPSLWPGYEEDDGIPSTAGSVQSIRQDDQFTVIDTEFEGQNADGAAFNTGWRFWLPRSPSGWAGAQCLWIENTGSAPLDAAALVPWHQHDGGPREDPGTLSRANAQGFYIPLAAVDHPEDGVGFGITALQLVTPFVHYRTGDDTARGSYARLNLGLKLEPGQREQVDGPLFAIFGYRADEPAGLMSALKEQVERVRQEVGAFCSPEEPEGDS